MDSPIAHRTRSRTARRQQQENARSNRSRSPRDRIVAEDQPAPARPLAREYQALPTCTICLSEIEVGEDTTLHCSHQFHSNCIDTWRAQSNTCPLCRAVMDFFPPQDVDRREIRRINFWEIPFLRGEDAINLDFFYEIDEFGNLNLVFYV